ncbi:MAG: DUF1559 domain-containing protein [Fimbriimonadaceae bacterium]|nr:DUF1559 domain-containing protein [Fimbriimonadaceae bacterium]
MNRMLRRPTGFTLIELLVVIAIIAILAAILFPVFAKAREKARQSSCASNEKQLGLAFQQYKQDYDEKWPAVYNDHSGSGLRLIWGQVIVPYIKSNQIYACPSANIDTATNIQNTRYQMNMAHGWCWPEGTNNSGLYGYPINDSQINSPAEFQLLLESSNAWYNHWLPGPTAGWAQTTTDNNGLILRGQLGETGYPRHAGGMNITFVDGHVKWASTNSMLAPDAPVNRAWFLGAP